MPRSTLLSRLFLIIATLISPSIYAAASVLIWPINPVISEDENATALWLENKDSQPVYMQIRVLGWQQVEGKDDYLNQTALIASPPVANILPGQRQLIRLIKNTPVPAGQEQSYRILVDEIPRKEPAGVGAPQAVKMGLTFQMRYSVPLFVYGAGMQAKRDINNPADTHKLSYQLLQQGDKQTLAITNQGSIHARLSQVSMQNKMLNEGLLGYVLPGKQMHFPVSSAVKTGELRAMINEMEKPIIIPHQ